MNHISKKIKRLFIYSSLLVVLFMTSCGQQATRTSVVPATSLPSATVTATHTVPAPTPTVTPTVTPTATPTITAIDYYERGLDDLLVNNWELAIDEFSQAIDLDPLYTDAFYIRGLALAIQGNVDLAIADWSKVIEIDPEYVDAYLGRAYAYDDSGDYEKAIADYDKVIELNPRHTEAYYWRGFANAWIGETDKAISDLEKSLALGLDPVLEGDAQAALEELNQMAAGEIVFDGYWTGNTSQGELITFEIEDNGIGSYSVGFQIPGCESFSPVAVHGNGEPISFVEGNRFSNVNNAQLGSGFVVINGTFTSSITAIGTLEISCESGLSTSWTASKGTHAARTPTPADLDKIPQTEISADLYSKEDGADNFDDYTSIMATNGDWFLLRYFAEWVIPIPAGWTSVATINGAYFLFGKEGGSEDFSVEIEIGQVCEEAGETSEEAIAQIEEDIADDANIEALKKEIVDDKKGYLLIEAKTEADATMLQLFLVSKSSEHCFHYLSAKTDEKDWDDFFPVIHAIYQNWFDLSGNFLGVVLPERLLE